MAHDEGVSLEHITAIADRLVAAGIEPALRAVRDRLGAGSTETILAFLQEWRGAQEKRAVGDLKESRLTESRLRADLAHQTQATSEHCAAIVPLTAERDTLILDLAKAVLRLEYVPCLEAALKDMQAERDREHKGRVQAEQEVASLTRRITALEVHVRELHGQRGEARPSQIEREGGRGRGRASSEPSQGQNKDH